jgi:hypothetical protein
MGVREAAFSANQNKYVSIDQDPIKFGKRVNFGFRMTTSQLLEDHLQAIKMQKMTMRYFKDSRIKEERDWLNSIH